MAVWETSYIPWDQVVREKRETFSCITDFFGHTNDPIGVRADEAIVFGPREVTRDEAVKLIKQFLMENVLSLGQASKSEGYSRSWILACMGAHAETLSQL